MTDYSFGKTYRLKDGYTALNGCVQYYTVEFDSVAITAPEPVEGEENYETKLAAYKAAQANFLRALEVLRTYGGQPIVTQANEKILKFTLEQPNVYGFGIKNNGEEQVSAKWDDGEEEGTKVVNSFIKDAEAKIKDLFVNVKAVDGTTPFTVKTATVEKVLF